MRHCPISTAATHIGSIAVLAVAVKVAAGFWSLVGSWFRPIKAIPGSHLEPIIPLFHTVVTVTAKWFNKF